MPITWCPGCPNNVILYVLKSVLKELVDAKKIRKQDIVVVTDIGCAGKIYDYLEVNAFYGLHGRAIPIATGIKIGNLGLTVIAVAGDGGTYSEGLNHLVSSSRLNPDITVIVINNGVLALTKGQPTSTHPSIKGEPVFDPVPLALASQASFVSRETAFDLRGLQSTVKAAIMHKGFSLVDIFEPCLSYNNDGERLKRDTERVCGKEIQSGFGESLKPKIRTGVFRKISRPTLEQKLRLSKKKS